MSRFSVEGSTLFAAGDIETGDLAAFEQAVTSVLAASGGEILLDFTGVEYMPSSFLGVLMSFRARLAKEGRTPPPVARRPATPHAHGYDIGDNARRVTQGVTQGVAQALEFG